jgi:UDP-glucose 4-epimerase
MRILVTGGAGYIGSELVHLLNDYADAEQIIVYDNLSRSNYAFFLSHKFPGNKVQFVQGDILDSRKLRQILKGIDVVYHMAATVTTPFANTDAHNFEQVNHWGTAELVYALEESSVDRIIYLSSASVYGSTNKPVDETFVPNPKTLYGISKLRAEDHMRRLEDKKRVYILRCGNVYGFNPSLRFDAVINRFAFEANFNRRISIHGNGKQHRSFIHIQLVGRVLKELCYRNIPKGTYNLVDKNLTVLDIVDEFKEIYPDLEFIFINQHLQLREMQIQQPEKLREVLPFQDNRTLKDELEEFKQKFSF